MMIFVKCLLAVAKDEPSNNKEPMVSMASMLDSMMDTDNHIDNNMSDGAAFSDEEDDIPLGLFISHTLPYSITMRFDTDIDRFVCLP